MQQVVAEYLLMDQVLDNRIVSEEMELLQVTKQVVQL